MTSNDFIIEIYFKVFKGHKDGILVSKSGNSGYGYQLGYGRDGRASFVILNDGASLFVQNSKQKINDGGWHHMLVEVNRAVPSGNSNCWS